jgi:prepilin signal peptidase PulO-like enzyme (type II secretory pathway)
LVNHLADVLPDDLNLIHPVCKNPECVTRIRWTDYILLRRCRVCNKAPSPRIYLVLLVAIAFAVYLWYFPPPKLGFLSGFILFNYLSLVCLIDLEHRLVLRPVSLVGVVICILAGLVIHGWQATLAGAVAGFGIMFLFYLLGILFIRLRKRRPGKAGTGEEALGSGDVTLATLLGMLMGWPLILLNLFMGILLAGVYSFILIIVLVITKKYRTLMITFAYGPFFIVVSILLLFFPKWISALIPYG